MTKRQLAWEATKDTLESLFYLLLIALGMALMVGALMSPLWVGHEFGVMQGICVAIAELVLWSWITSFRRHLRRQKDEDELDSWGCQR